jgi:hypothetical protein
LFDFIGKEESWQQGQQQAFSSFRGAPGSMGQQQGMPREQQQQRMMYPYAMNASQHGGAMMPPVQYQQQSHGVGPAGSVSSSMSGSGFVQYPQQQGKPLQQQQQHLQQRYMYSNGAPSTGADYYPTEYGVPQNGGGSGSDPNKRMASAVGGNEYPSQGGGIRDPHQQQQQPYDYEAPPSGAGDVAGGGLVGNLNSIGEIESSSSSHIRPPEGNLFYY